MQSEENNELKALTTSLREFTPFQKISEKEDIVEILFGFLKSLTREEKNILEIFLASNCVLNIRKIRKKYTILLGLNYSEFLERLDFIKEKVKEHEKKTGNTINLSSFEHLIYFLPRLVARLSEPEFLKLVSTLNKVLPEKIIDSRKIKSILEEFEKMGLVKRRELKGRHEKYGWFLSPSFTKICFSVLSYLEKKEKEKKLTSLEKEVLSFLKALVFFPGVSRDI